MPLNSVQSRGGRLTRRPTCSILLIFLLLLFLPHTAFGDSLGTAEIRVLGIRVDADTRPDIDGFQTVMTTVKRFPAEVRTFVGFPGESTLPSLPEGMQVRAELSGPGLTDGPRTLSAAPNQPMAIPELAVPGEYLLSDVRLVDEAGHIVLERDPAAAPIIITVIEKLLVTQVTSRPLTLEEIEEKGIVIDEENFTAMNFSVGLTLGSKQVEIELPMVIPNSSQGVAYTPRPSAQFPKITPKEFAEIDIPNFSLVGFSLQKPPELEEQAFEIPPVTGVIVIPGNIAFLNQFFSVILQAANVAPDDSGLVLNSAKAAIALPPGEDEIENSADDPLGIPEADGQDAGQKEKPITDGAGGDAIYPGQTHQAEFIVEGLREGTHMVNFEITGDLYIPSIGETRPMTGKAAGVVQVKNPTFSITLAHPDVVREGEDYSLFATVTNTSSSPANLFQLTLNTRSLSGAALAEGETKTKTLDTLLPGQAETFEYRMTALQTGEVTGTVFLADDRINGSFVLTTGVGDTGIPLSPDSLILPRTVDYLPDEPDLVFAAVRLLGQAYSVATAPAGSLPADVSRVSKNYVFEKAVKLAQAGLHARFGESGDAVVQDILLDYLGSDMGRLGRIYPGSEETAEKDMRAFDSLRRTAGAGKNLTETIAELLGKGLSGASLAVYQGGWAERFASRPPHLSFGIETSGDPVYALITDENGSRLGRADASASGASEWHRDIPFGDRFDLLPEGPGHAELLVVAAPESESYTLSFFFPEAVSGAALSLVIPASGGMKQVVWPPVSLPAGSRGEIICQPDGENDFEFAVDTDGDGAADRTISAQSAEPVADSPPSLISARQWAKGNIPLNKFSFETGDPLGRMTGILFSEEVTRASATDMANYTMPNRRIEQISFQPDRRMVFLITGQPAGPFVDQTVSVAALTDMKDNQVTESAPLSVQGDPERGVAGRVSGVVRGPDGRAVPFAEIKYIQPVNCPECDQGHGHTKDYLISTLFADAGGRFQVDFVLQNGATSEDPDHWLNDRHAGGTDHFKLEASDPATGNIGKASTRIRFDGQHMALNVIIRGYGRITGNVYEEDGTPVTGGEPGILPVIARNISTGEIFASWVDASGSYSFPRSLAEPSETLSGAPEVTVGNVILRILRADGSTGVTTVNIPGSGMTVEQDIVLLNASRYGTVSGRVLESDGVTGAARVLVQVSGQVLTSLTLYERTYQSGVVGTVYTDGNGFFSFEDVPAGDIEVRAVRQATYEQAGAKAVLEENGSRSLTLVLPGASGAVAGAVFDAKGNPVSGAKVAAGVTLTETDENGRFSASGLPTGHFTIYAQAPDSAATGQAEVDIFSSDDVYDNLVITLEPVGSISGTVFEADGVTPVAGQKVQLWVGSGASSDGGVMAEAYTNADGNYLFSNYPVNQYAIKAVRKDYGDGGMAVTAITHPDDVKDADIIFRGLAEITGTVKQTNGTPVIADVIITRKVWRIITDGPADGDNYYLDYVEQLQQETDKLTAAEMQSVLDETGATSTGNEFFMLLDEPVLVSSDILGPNGEVTGQYHYEGAVTAGPVRASAFGPFLAPAEVTADIPRITNPSDAVYPDGRIYEMPPILLEPSVGSVTGTVFMPDGKIPAGAGVKVTIQSLDNSGSVRIPDNYGESAGQPVLPEYSVITGPDGVFEFPVVLKGRFILTADTLEVPVDIEKAETPSEAVTQRFYDADEKQACDDAYDLDSPDYENCLNEARVLNVRLLGRLNGVVPAGGEVNAEIRLNGVAGIKVKVVENDGVTPVSNAEVLLTTASSLDEEEGAVFADENGEISFFPVMEGNFSVSARKEGMIQNGRASGNIPVNPSDGTETAVTVTLGAVTTGSGQVVAAEIFGTVTGTIYKADGTPLENPAEVTVTASGASVLTTSDAAGRFTADLVPGGVFRVDAFEPFTARRGTAQGRIENDGATADVAVTLVGLGTVNGRVMSADGSEVIYGADVVLSPAGDFSDRLISRTDALGAYSLPGVPVGNYTVLATDYATELTGTAQGAMTGDEATVTTDVYMEPSGSIIVTVYGPGVYIGEDGAPAYEDGTPWPDAPVSADTEVTLSGSGIKRTDRTDENGVFGPIRNLPAGTYSVSVKSGNDGAEAEATVSHEGETVEVSTALAGYGTVRGVIKDSLCEFAVNAVEVVLHSQSPYASGSFTINTESDGVFQFDNVPVGKFSISAVTAVGDTRLGASAAGKIARHGDTAVFEEADAVCLQDSGTIEGLAVLPDGVTPAAGAVAEVSSGSIRVVRIADDSGAFSFTGLPLGEYTLSVRETVTNSVAGRTVFLNINGQVVSLGTLVLDGESPAVVSTSPADEATDVNPAEAMTLTFSEKIDPLSVTGTAFRVLADGTDVPGTVSVSEAVVTFTPDSPGFPDLKQITVIARGDRRDLEGRIIDEGVSDMAGLGMAADYIFTFSTGDSTPPSLKSISPADGAVEAGLDSVVRIAFSEPVDRASFTLSLESDGSPVAGAINETPVFGDQVFIFTPDAPLSANKTCSFKITGPVGDLAGNVMEAAEIVTSFSTIDTLAPVISSLDYDTEAALIFGNTLRFTVVPEISEEIASLELSVNGEAAAVLSDPPYEYGLFLDPALGTEIRVGVTAVDAAGNRSEEKIQLLSISENQPPDVMITSPGTGSVTQGDTITVQVITEDDTGLASVSFSANGSAGGEESLSGPASHQAEFSFTVPPDAAAGETIILTAAAADISGLTSVSGEVVLTVEDHAGPQVTIGSPADHAVFDPGAGVSIIVAAEDVSGVRKIRISTAGALVFEDTLAVDPAASPASGTFNFVIPADALPTQTITVTATAEDSAGNTGTSEITLNISDMIPPVVGLSAVDSDAPLAGEEFRVKVIADDESGVTEIRVKADEFYTENRTVTLTAHTEQIFAFTVSADTPAGSEITVSARAWDKDGNEADSPPLVITTADGTPPSVEITSPADGAEVMPGTALEIHVHASDNYQLASVSYKAEGAVAAEETKTVEDSPEEADIVFSLDVPADAAPDGAFTLYAMAADTAGSSVNSGFISLHVADVVPPEVEAVTPADGSVNVAVNSVITVEFSEPVEPDTVNAESFRIIRTDGGTSEEISGLRVLTDENRKVTWVPDSGLAFGGIYKVSVSEGVTDRAGNPAVVYESAGFTVTGFGFAAPAAGSRIVESQTLALQSDISNADGIREIRYTADSAIVGTGGTPPSFDAGWEIPLTHEQREVTVSAEAVTGGENLALTAQIAASEGSSDYSFVPSRAADGNTDPAFSAGSVAAVMGTPLGWWEAGLSRITRISRIDIHLNNGCCQQNNRFALLVASEPFAVEDFSGETLPAVFANSAVEVYRTSEAYDTGVVSVTGPFTGRYIRVVHLGEDFLGLAEVEIFDREALVAVPESVPVTVLSVDDDEDGDGVSNGDEVAAGTDPLN